MVAAIERGPANNQFIQDGPYAPEISLGVILVRLKNFRSHVQRGAAESVCQLVLLQVASKAKVGYLQHCLWRVIREQQVLRLQVSLQEERHRLKFLARTHSIHSMREVALLPCATCFDIL